GPTGAPALPQGARTSPERSALSSSHRRTGAPDIRFDHPAAARSRMARRGVPDVPFEPMTGALSRTVRCHPFAQPAHDIVPPARGIRQEVELCPLLLDNPVEPAFVVQTVATELEVMLRTLR